MKRDSIFNLKGSHKARILALKSKEEKKPQGRDKGNQVNSSDCLKVEKLVTANRDTTIKDRCE